MAAAPLPADEPIRNTSIRLPVEEHHAAMEAVKEGMDPTFTEAVRHSLRDRVDDFFRRRALAGYFREFPESVPALADLASRRVSGSDHPAATRRDLVEIAAAHVEARRPTWAEFGDVDDAVDEVLFAVELLADIEDA